MKTQYKEIHKLKKMLEDADIPFDWIEGWGYGAEERKLLSVIAPDLIDRYQICYPEGSFNNDEKRWISVIEGFGTYGSEQDKLEIMGGLTPMERYESIRENINIGEVHTTVKGGLTARNVFNRIKNKWEEDKNGRGRD